MSACADRQSSAQAFVDGELEGAESDEFQRHLGACGACARTVHLEARFKAALRGHLSRPEVPSELTARLGEALDAAGPPGRRGAVAFVTRRPWVVLPMAAAAAALVMVSVRDRSPVMEQVLTLHNAELPADVAGPDCVRIGSWLGRKVGFPVHPPQPRGYVCRGGRVVPVGGTLGAEVTYGAPDGRDVKLVIYDARQQPPVGRERVPVRGQDVYIDRAPGVTAVGARDSGGMGFVATSSSGPDSLVQFVSHEIGH